MSSSCSCGSDCKCGSGCKCGEIENTATATLIAGVAPPVQMYSEGSEKSSGAAEGGHGCKCGSNCTCDPCNC